MSRFSPEALRLVVSDTTANLYRHGWRRGWQQCASVALAPAYRFPHELLLSRLPALLDGQPGKGRLSVMLPDKAARFFMVTPPRNIARFSELQAIAGLRLESLLGLSPAEWHIEADWQSRQPFLAVAMPVALRDGLHASASAHGMRLTSLLPVLVTRWNRMRARLKAGDWLVSCGSDRAIVVVAGQRRIASVFPLELPEEGRGQSLAFQPILDAACYRLQLPAPARIHLLHDGLLAWHEARLGATTVTAWAERWPRGGGGRGVPIAPGGIEDVAGAPE